MWRVCLNHPVDWKVWKKHYGIMQKRIHAGKFAWPGPSSHSEPPPSHAMEATRESFAISSPSNVTPRFVLKKSMEFKMALHSGKVVRLPPRRRHLAEPATAALENCVQCSACHANSNSGLYKRSTRAR